MRLHLQLRPFLASKASVATKAESERVGQQASNPAPQEPRPATTRQLRRLSREHATATTTATCYPGSGCASVCDPTESAQPDNPPAPLAPN